MQQTNQNMQHSSTEVEAPRVSVAVVAKRGPHSKWFDAHAARVAGPLLLDTFGVGWGKATMREMDVCFVTTISLSALPPASAEVVAVALVTPSLKAGRLKMCGVCVALAHRGRGYGTRLMEQLPGLLPPTTRELELCVDVGTPTTERLRAFYERLGYEWRGVVRVDGDEALMVRAKSQ